MLELIALGKSPKELRAMAKQLVALAKTMEMAQDPQKYTEKIVKAKVHGAKRRVKYSGVKNIKL